MNKLWNLEHFSAEALHRTVRRDGLRIRIHPQVHPFLRREVHTFVRWLRANYPFPIRVNVYIPNTKKIRANDGDLCYGRCFVPDDPDDSITIDVARGLRLRLRLSGAAKLHMGNHLHAGARAGALLPVPEPRFADSARD